MVDRGLSCVRPFALAFLKHADGFRHVSIEFFLCVGLQAQSDVLEIVIGNVPAVDFVIVSVFDLDNLPSEMQRQRLHHRFSLSVGSSQYSQTRAGRNPQWALCVRI